MQTLTNIVFVARKNGEKRPLTTTLDAVEEQIQQLKRSFDRLSLVARASYVAVAAEPTKLGTLLEALANEPSLGGGRLELAIKNPELDIFVDNAMIACALGELLKNAFEASPSGDTVLLESTLQPDRLQLAVHDRGHASWPEPIEDAIDLSYTTKHSTLGAGLCIACLVASAHDGTLELHPREGGGTTALFSISTAWDKA
jgi:K+-sensing histidine kinase KdpD